MARLRNSVAARRLAALLAAALASTLTVEAAQAGPIADAAAEAEALLAAGSPAEIWEQFDRATELFWAEAPLAFRRALLVESADGYGQFEPRGNAPFATGDRLIAYLEPVGFGWTALGEQYRIRFTVDVVVASVGDGVIVAEPGFAAIEHLGRARSREFEATLEMTLPDLSADHYVLRVTLHDAATGKSATTELAFEVR